VYEELYELLTDTMEPEEALKWMQDFADKIDNDPGEVISELDNFIYDKAIGKNLCPMCFAGLEKRTYQDHREYQGRPTDETIYVTMCPDCNLEID
jgi:hypothetical protein